MGFTVECWRKRVVSPCEKEGPNNDFPKERWAPWSGAARGPSSMNDGGPALSNKRLPLWDRLSLNSITEDGNFKISTTYNLG